VPPCRRMLGGSRYRPKAECSCGLFGSAFPLSLARPRRCFHQLLGGDRRAGIAGIRQGWPNLAPPVAEALAAASASSRWPTVDENGAPTGNADGRNPDGAAGGCTWVQMSPGATVVRCRA